MSRRDDELVGAAIIDGLGRHIADVADGTTLRDACELAQAHADRLGRHVNLLDGDGEIIKQAHPQEASDVVERQDEIVKAGALLIGDRVMFDLAGLARWHTENLARRLAGQNECEVTLRIEGEPDRTFTYD